MSIYNASDVENQLATENRDYNQQLSWQNAYNTAGVNYAKQNQMLKQSYDSAVLDAYKTHLDNSTAIKNSGIVNDSTIKALLQENENNLQAAYSTYMQNLQAGQNELGTAYNEQKEAIDTLLSEQAQNLVDFADSGYSYLEELAKRYNQGLRDFNNKYVQNEKGEWVDENGNVVSAYSGIFNDPAWSKYGSFDIDGNFVLNSYEDLYNTFYSLTEDGKRQGTLAGLDFFDKILNDTYDTGYSFDTYLKENNEDLYNWAVSYNPYDYNSAGTNLGSAKEMMGLAADDYKYTWLEYAGGLTNSELTSLFDDVTNTVAQLTDMSIDFDNKENNLNELSGKIDTVIDDLSKLASDYDMLDVLEEAGFTKDSFQELKNLLQSAAADPDGFINSVNDTKLLNYLRETGRIDDAMPSIAWWSLNNNADGFDPPDTDGTTLVTYFNKVADQYNTDEAKKFFEYNGYNVLLDANGKAMGVYSSDDLKAAAQHSLASELQDFESAYDDAVSKLVNTAQQARHDAQEKAGLLPNAFEMHQNNTSDVKTTRWNSLPNKSVISTMDSSRYNYKDINTYLNNKNATITDNNGNTWKVKEVISNKIAKDKGYGNGDVMLSSIIGTDDFNTKDGKITKGALNNTFYVAMGGTGTWLVLEPA